MYMKKGLDLHEENIRTPSWDLYGENMRYTFREHKLYVNRAWDVKKSIREYKISMKRSWDLNEEY